MSDEQLKVDVWPRFTDMGKFTYNTRYNTRIGYQDGDEYHVLLQEIVVMFIKPKPWYLPKWLWRRLMQLLLGFYYI